MVCGFCPGSGTPAEKSFNRADVFKRHLTAAHGVEQTPPSSRKKIAIGSASNGLKKLTGYAPDATGKCSTCTTAFDSAQDFYEHLDDCVLRVVQHEDPAEAINIARLASSKVEADRRDEQHNGHITLEKDHLPVSTTTNEDEDEEMDDDDGADQDLLDDDRDLKPGTRTPPKTTIKNKGGTNRRPSNGGVRRSRGRAIKFTRSRRAYPSSWGFDKGQMNMK